MSVIQLVTALFQTYEKQEQKERLDIYVAMLKDIPTELLREAIKKCIAECKYLPSIAEILEQCESFKTTIKGEQEYMPWDEAWQIIYKEWEQGSPYKPKPKWPTPEIEKTVERFGWMTLMEAPADQTMAIRAQMKSMYEAICKRHVETAKNKQILAGKNGFEQIGDTIRKAIGGRT